MSKRQILSSVYQVANTHAGPLPDAGNLTRILILLPESADWADEKAYLIKMFEAAGQTFGTDYSIVRIPNGATLSWIDLVRSSTVRDIYLFGIHPQQLGLQSNLKPGLPVTCSDILIFRTDLPLKVMNNGEMRATLWNFFQKRYLNREVENG